jgi:hypothetical protein
VLDLRLCLKDDVGFRKKVDDGYRTVPYSDGQAFGLAFILSGMEEKYRFCRGKSTGLSEPRTCSPHSSHLIGGGDDGKENPFPSSDMIGEDAVTK